MHHPVSINGQTFTIKDLIMPTHGRSEITVRVPTHPDYEDELLQITVISIQTKSGIKAETTERRVFRAKLGQWSIWNVNADHEVWSKFTDLDIMHTIHEPSLVRVGDHVREPMQRVEMRSVIRPFKVADKDNWLTLDFFMGHKAHWDMTHRIDPSENSSMISWDEYFPLPGGKMV